MSGLSVEQAITALDDIPSDANFASNLLDLVGQVDVGSGEGVTTVLYSGPLQEGQSYE